MKTAAFKTVKDIFIENFENLGNNIMDIHGGNIDSKVWFCGIEPGGDIEKSLEGYRLKRDKYPIKDSLIKKDILKKYSIEDLEIPLFLENIFEKKKEWYFDQTIGRIVSNWEENIDFFNYDNKISNVFKLNLFPLPAKDVDYWNKTHEEITGCTLKKEYYGKCIEKRFPMLRRLTEAANPKVVVCIGKTFINEFILAFWGNSNWWNEKGEQKMPEGIPYTDSNKSITVNVYSGDEGKPTLIVTPFFGWRYHCVNVNNPENAIFIGNLVSEVLKSRL